MTDVSATDAATTTTRAIQHLAERWIQDGTAAEGTAGRGRERWWRRGRTVPTAGFVCSPAGLWLALAAVAAGARGATAAELRALLGTADREAAPAVTKVARELAATGALGVATRVWSRVPVLRAYREALPDVRFDPMDPAAVDAWVREATGGLIERLPLEITDDTLLALVNVLALKARWEKPFEGWRTRDLPFTDAAGTVRPVPTMSKDVPMADAWTAGGAYVVELRCAQEPGGAPGARVRLVLGEPGAGPEHVLPVGWAPRTAGTALDTDRVTVGLPRLALRTRVPVTEQLPALGVRLATSDDADFSGLSPEPLRVSDVIQEAVLKIAEEGVEAAAVTVVAAPAGAAPRPQRVHHIAFDRPFGIVVLAGADDVPLFTAWQADTPAGPDA
ncbi:MULTISPECIES: serpin family protein [unclassified Streptomyces]|uniref:serpin family protein n=1 Tax=unclassified Streptomyces TaxID=2593676 RepID=UPI00190D083E|nr:MULTISPECIES: serpin family protein [unclassified Streptomyces]MBK3530992.1 serine protease [Streptomyces sp. MBT72]MBK3549975.1 serine protease [Streptomyces sp. MBT61]MBK6028616.1 serine protease [Streptomyces sp. MBT59]